jgi:hypothetical protein
MRQGQRDEDRTTGEGGKKGWGYRRMDEERTKDKGMRKLE